MKGKFVFVYIVSYIYVFGSCKGGVFFFWNMLLINMLFFFLYFRKKFGLLYIIFRCILEMKLEWFMFIFMFFLLLFWLIEICDWCIKYLKFLFFNLVIVIFFGFGFYFFLVGFVGVDWFLRVNNVRVLLFEGCCNVDIMRWCWVY